MRLGCSTKSLNQSAVHGVEAHFIANKHQTQADHFNLEGQVHNVLGQKKHSACALRASRLHNQLQVSVATQFKDCETWSRISDVARLAGLLWWFMTTPAHHCNAKSHHCIWLGTVRSSPYSPVLSPSDFHLFMHLKSFLAGRQIHERNEVKEAITTFFA